MKRLCLLLVALLSAAAQTDIHISARSTVSQPVMRIGDKIRYTVEIEYDTRLQIQTPGEAANLGYFEIKDYTIGEPRQTGSRMIERYEYVISTYDTGHYVIPPFPVGYAPRSQPDLFRIIEAPEQALYVKSIFLNDSVVNAKPRPIKPEIDMPLLSRWWVWLLIAALCIGGYVLWRHFRASKPEPTEAPITPLKAHEIAIMDLNRLRGFTSTDPDDIDRYYTQLSYVLRRYIEQRFQTSAMEETSEELAISLRQIAISEPQYNDVMDIIRQADMVKFAKRLPDASDFEPVFTRIYKFISATKPVEQTMEVTSS